MCGIFFTRRQIVATDMVDAKHRGPDNTVEVIVDSNTFIFNRLSINGQDQESNQPFQINNCVVMCNGEIYNHKYLWKLLGKEPQSGSDCEIIVELYREFGMDYLVKVIDGVFAIILYDKLSRAVYVVRDPFGVRPLFQCSDDTFSSEMKQIRSFGNVKQFNPGTYSIICSGNRTDHVYFTQNISHRVSNLNLYDSFKEAVTKRVNNTDREIGCLLSGGFDSSVVAAIVCSLVKDKKVKTFSIGLDGSTDIIRAREVAKWIKSEHHELILTEQEFLEAIPEVIKVIESYDTTTVRASVGNYLIAKYISENTNCKVLFNGDGADELLGGYVYLNQAPNALDFDRECRRLLRDIHYFDVLRSDRCISGNGLEPRTPFLDKNFVQDYLSVPPDRRFTPQQEKQYFRDIVYSNNKDLLPLDIIYRRKEAFSDGVSGEDRSWYKIIQESLSDKVFSAVLFHNIPTTKEQYYYRTIFDKEYPDKSKVIPYFWMPKYVNTTDPSARSIN